MNMRHFRKGYLGFWSIIITLSIFSVSCDKPIVNDSNNDDADTIKVVDEYYVKYEVDSKSIYITSRYSQINSDKNTTYDFTFSSSPWETTMGPVKKGFTARLKAGYTSASINNSSIGAKIYICKNNGPFALKKFDLSSADRTLVEISYVIDF